MGILKKVSNIYNDSEIRKLEKTAEKIMALDEVMSKLSNEELKAKTEEFKEKLANGSTLDDILVEAFAVVREAAYRTIGLKHYKVQIIGGIVLHQGRIAEMKTGEGKTLVSTLPAYLNALEGKGVHIVTVNDYLAKRDKEQMGQVHEFLGLKTGVILQKMTPDERVEQYQADITYGTNSEFGFDHLRDNMVKALDAKVQRTLHYCIIDEVDSVLIDEARTPLIISGPGTGGSELYKVADYFVRTLKEKEHYEIDHKAKAVLLGEAGVEAAEKFFKVDDFMSLENMSLQHHVVQALKANYIMKKEVDYIIQDGKIVLVDTFTGRIMDGRRFSDGLHEAIEAKENVEIEGQNKTFATITYQNFFRMYKKLAGMTGTAKTEENEFREIYSLDVVVIPTNRPIQRIDKDDILYGTEYDKFKAVVEDVEETYKRKQPILVGTASVEKSEILSFMLKRKGIPHQVLNAKHHEKEAEIVSKAGQVGMVTIATNMAGRGTDIILSEEARALGGLKVIGTERHESRRIDNQLRGRSGRQGDVGESVFYGSFEDEIIKVHASEKFKNKMEKLDLKPSEAIQESMATKALENAQKNVEGSNFETRKTLIKYDDVINRQRKLIYGQRDEVLEGKNLEEQILNMAYFVVEDGVTTYLLKTNNDDKFDAEVLELTKYFNNIFNFRGNIDIEQLKNKNAKEIEEFFKESVISTFEVIKEKYKEQLEEVIKGLLITVVDNNWVDHLERMEHLKQYIGFSSLKQQDPAQAYQLQGSEVFNEMISNIKKDATTFMFNSIK